MKTVINELTGEYTLTFSSRAELERFSYGQIGIRYYATIPSKAGERYLNKDVIMEHSGLLNDDLKFLFRENGAVVAEQKIPIRFLREYDSLCAKVFEFLSEKIKDSEKENGAA